MVSEISHLIFDLDGVLVDSSSCHEAAYSTLWKKLGITGPLYEHIAGKKTLDVVTQYTKTLNPTPKNIRQWVGIKQKLARNELRNSLTIFPDVDTVVKNLYAHGWKMSVATGASLKSAVLALDLMDVCSCFEFMITAEDVERGKPDPMAINIAVQRAGVSAQSTLVVEDSISGIKAAIAAGVRVCSVNTGVTLNDELFAGAYENLSQALKKLGIIE